MTIYATVSFESANGSEGNSWTNCLVFFSEDQAKKAARALVDCGVTNFAVVTVRDHDARGREERRVAQIEFTQDNELTVFEHRVPPLFDVE